MFTIIYEQSLNPDLVLLITTGFLGAYTTFSSYELDTANLLEAKNLQNDLAYWIGSPLLGLLCFNLGVRLTKYVIRRDVPWNVPTGVMIFPTK